MIDVQFEAAQRADAEIALVEPLGSRGACARSRGCRASCSPRARATCRCGCVAGHRSYRTALQGIPPRRRAAAPARRRAARDRGSAGGPAAHRPAGRAARRARRVTRSGRGRSTGRRNQRERPGRRHRPRPDRPRSPTWIATRSNRLTGDADTRLDACPRGSIRRRPTRCSARLKEFPRVAIAASKTAMLANFRETSARNVLFFTTILTGVRGDDRDRRRLQQRPHRAAGARLGAREPARARLHPRRGVDVPAGRARARAPASRCRSAVSSATGCRGRSCR